MDVEILNGSHKNSSIPSLIEDGAGVVVVGVEDTVVRACLLVWDVAGLAVNGLGIDLMWHGIEINHAVYSLVLQDICLCWVSTAVWGAALNWIWWWSPSEGSAWDWYYLAYLAWGSLPLAFHDCAWAMIAYLRHLNVTDNEAWLELDLGALRTKTGLATWFLAAVQLGLFLPLLSALLMTTTTTPLELVLLPLWLLVLVVSVLPHLVAFWFYFKILRHAKKLALQEQEEAQELRGPLPSPSFHCPASALFGDVDDDDDDDDVDDDDHCAIVEQATTSPSVKQECASLLAFKTTTLFCVCRLLSVSLLAFSATMKRASQAQLAFAGLAPVAVITCLVRHPVILTTSVLNFGPLRNTAALYADNLPERLSVLAAPLAERLMCLLKRASLFSRRRGEEIPAARNRRRNNSVVVGILQASMMSSDDEMVEDVVAGSSDGHCSSSAADDDDPCRGHAVGDPA